MKKVISVGKSTPVPQLAGSIVWSLEENHKIVEIRAMGASAVSQAVKALAVARGMLASQGIDLLVRPSFDTIDDNGIDKTVIVMTIVIGGVK